MQRLLAKFLLLIAVASLVGCQISADATAKFGDQNFKTAVALVELHKVRYGSYPKSLSDIRFAGEWDSGPLRSVEYRVIGNGYELNIVRGWGYETPQLSYPPEFWQGLGLVKSNVKGAPQLGGT
jgi:hypothetical protein